jgi:hypothetical protein
VVTPDAKSTGPEGREEELPGRQTREEKTPGRKQPELSADFYKTLLELPACKTRGTCDGCGRCRY